MEVGRTLLPMKRTNAKEIVSPTSRKNVEENVEYYFTLYTLTFITNY